MRGLDHAPAAGVTDVGQGPPLFGSDGNGREYTKTDGTRAPGICSGHIGRLTTRSVPMVPMRAHSSSVAAPAEPCSLRGLASATFFGLLIVGLLVGCGSGGSGSSGAQPTTPQAGITVVEISNPSVSTIAVVADQYGKESLTLVGEKDALGRPERLTEILYSVEGDDLQVELGLDGLPSVISDQIGNKISLTNYTAGTVDLTFIDYNGDELFGPSTISIDSAGLTSLRNANAIPQQTSVAGIPVASSHGFAINTRWLLAAASTNVSYLSCGMAIGATAAAIGSVLPPVVAASGGLSAFLTKPILIALAKSAVSCGVAIGSSYSLIANINSPTVEITSRTLDLTSVAPSLIRSSIGPSVVVSLVSIAITGVRDYTDYVPLPQPQVLLVVPQHGQIKILWNMSFVEPRFPWRTIDQAIIGYRIRRDDGKLFDVVNRTAYFDDHLLTPGRPYCYQVRAY